MKFDKYLPAERLKPYIKYFVISENESEAEYKVFPGTGLVIGFQYRGSLMLIDNKSDQQLSSSGISGISDSYRIFRNSANIGTLLVYFTETGFAHFTSHPSNELFNLSVSLDNIFDPDSIMEIEGKLSLAGTDLQRIHIAERFFQSRLRDVRSDKVIAEAVKLIYESNGNIRIKELNEKLFISQSPLEKRFRKIVGTSPKKFASIVRFNAVINHFSQARSLSEICYENNFFDQSHFIKSFRQFTGDTPENFKDHV